MFKGNTGDFYFLIETAIQATIYNIKDGLPVIGPHALEKSLFGSLYEVVDNNAKVPVIAVETIVEEPKE